MKLKYNVKRVIYTIFQISKWILKGVLYFILANSILIHILINFIWQTIASLGTFLSSTERLCETTCEKQIEAIKETHKNDMDIVNSRMDNIEKFINKQQETKLKRSTPYKSFIAYDNLYTNFIGYIKPIPTFILEKIVLPTVLTFRLKRFGERLITYY